MNQMWLGPSRGQLRTPHQIINLSNAAVRIIAPFVLRRDSGAEAEASSCGVIKDTPNVPGLFSAAAICAPRRNIPTPHGHAAAVAGVFSLLPNLLPAE